MLFQSPYPGYFVRDLAALVKAEPTNWVAAREYFYSYPMSCQATLTGSAQALIALENIATAHPNDARTHYYIGSAYWYGRGTKVDASKAIASFTRAEDLGDADAQHTLGIAYRDAVGVRNNLRKSKEMFSRAAASGNQESLKELFALCEISVAEHINFQHMKPEQVATVHDAFFRPDGRVRPLVGIYPDLKIAS